MCFVCLSEAGQEVFFHCVGIKGDLKFLAQAFNLDRHAGKEEVGTGEIETLMYGFSVCRMLFCISQQRMCL